MSRRTPSFRDGTSWVVADLLLDQLSSVLETLSEREAAIVRMRFGLIDEEPKTLDEIGQVYGVTRERIRQIEMKTMQKLRHPSRASVLRDYVDFDESGSLAAAMRRARKERYGTAVHEQNKPVRCGRHGWFIPREGDTKCHACPCPLYRYYGEGRPRVYCSDACRQSAYRARQRARRNQRGASKAQR